MKAIRLQELYNGPVEDQQKLTLKFFEEWVAKLKRRWKLKTALSQGEDGNYDDSAVAAALPALQHKIAGFAFKDSDSMRIYLGLLDERLSSGVTTAVRT
eukprot:IDg6228t1